MKFLIKTFFALTYAFIFLANPLVSFAIEGDILLSDDFNDGNFNGWTVESGNWFINNGNLVGSKSGRAFGGRINNGSSQWDNYKIELDFNAQSGIDHGVGFRYTPNGDSYEINFRHGTGSFNTPEIVLRKNQSGIVTTLFDTHSFPLINQKWYHLKVEVNNENIKAWIGNTLIFDITDSGTLVKKGVLTLSYWTGDISYIYVRFDNIKVTSLTPIPTPTPSPTPTPIPRTPLILIPGIGGSELKVVENTIWNKDDGHGGTFNHAYSAGEKVWVNENEAIKAGNDDYFDILRMKTDGVTSEANIGLTDNLLTRAYGETINFFVENGSVLNQDLFIFPYDWRKDISGTTSLLDQKIQNIKQQTGAQKVDIVAHSMGGLVARNYIADPQKAQNVRKLFTLGTPHLGSVKFLKAIRYGICLVEIGPLCPILIPLEVNDVLQNMVSGYQLAPSQAYFNFYSGDDNLHPYPYKTKAGTLNYSQIKDLLITFGHNANLFNPSEIFHSLDNNLSNTNGVDVTVIAGSGQPTLGQIIEEKTTSLLGIKGIHKDIKIINGDKTVPLLSASLNDPSKNLSLLGDAKLFYSKQEHDELIAPGSALSLVKNILEGKTSQPEGVSNQPYPLSLLWSLSSHSPVNIHAYDTNGNHTGTTSNGDLETNIPGSSYDTLDDAKFIYLPENGVYDIKFEATDNGSFDFKIRKYENDENTKTILYNDIPLTDQTKAETTFDTLSTAPPALQVDQDGNGTVDTVVNASSTLIGDTVNDSTAPQTEVLLSGTEGLNSWYKSDVTVNLNSQDEVGGSGLLKTEYTLDGQTINTYTQPFTISHENIIKLKFRSIDNAGNEENPKEVEIKIDKTAPEAKIYVDQDKQDLVVEGIDTNSTTITSQPNNETKKKDDAIYTITDIAGNKTILDVREQDKEKQDRFRIHSIKYNEENPIILPNNYFNVGYNGKKDKLNVKEQNFEDKGEVKIRIQYNQKKNQSTIIVKEPKDEKVKEIKDGLVLLQLLTNKGQLETTY